MDMDTNMNMNTDVSLEISREDRHIAKAFHEGIEKYCPRCGSSVITLTKLSCKEVKGTSFFVAGRIEYACHWCDNKWAERVFVDKEVLDAGLSCQMQ